MQTPKTLRGRDIFGRPIRGREPYARVMAQTKRRGECLEFTGPRNEQGYGRVYVGSYRQALAHRVVWRHDHPGDPEPRVVMHSCDNPPCVETTHLRGGTHAANSADMVAKGRNKPMRGEASGRAKLRTFQVEAIRGLSDCGLTTVEIAAMYGVRQSHISRIVTKERRAYG
jgi:hypothetical protein